MPGRNPARSHPEPTTTPQDIPKAGGDLQKPAARDTGGNTTTQTLGATPSHSGKKGG
jgi:hypothetical protein